MKSTYHYFLYYCFRAKTVSPGGKGKVPYIQAAHNIRCPKNILLVNGPWRKKVLCRSNCLPVTVIQWTIFPPWARLMGDTGVLRSPIFLSVSHQLDFCEQQHKIHCFTRLTCVQLFLWSVFGTLCRITECLSLCPQKMSCITYIKDNMFWTDSSLVDTHKRKCYTIKLTDFF